MRHPIIIDSNSELQKRLSKNSIKEALKTLVKYAKMLEESDNETFNKNITQK